MLSPSQVHEKGNNENYKETQEEDNNYYYDDYYYKGMDKVRNEEVRRRAGIERESASRADQSIEMVWPCGKNG